MKNIYEEPKLEITKFNVEENIMTFDVYSDYPAGTADADGSWEGSGVDFGDE